MSKLTGFNMEEMLNVTPLRGVLCIQEPKVEQATAKLRSLQQGKKALEKDIEEIKSFSASLQRELENLQTKGYQLEENLKEKEELCRKLQFQFDECEQDSARQLNQSKKSEELIEQYKCEIQEYKLKHRKQRMMFEQQLHQLTEQHKNLHSIFTPERLSDEINTSENRKVQLESAEQLKLGVLFYLDEELQQTRKQTPAGAEGPEQ